jgi:hypothetical protein
MRFRRTAAAAAATALAVIGVAASTVPADAQARDRGAQSFTIVSNDPEAATPAVFADGVIDARGVDVVINDNRDRFVFARGAIVVTHRATFNRERCNRDNGLGHFTERGTYRIVNGTRAYEGASGRGTYVVRGTFADCRLNAAPALFQLTIQADGRIRF